jgi:uncharacterized RDD family membrane protein YckC
MTKPFSLPTLSTSRPTDSPAPRARRALAFWLDLLLTVFIAIVAAVPVQLLWPPDTQMALRGSLLFGLAIAFLYLGFAPRLLGNTFGKWIFSLQLVAQDGGAVSSASLLKRLLLVGLWPINGFLVLMRRSRTHLGDSWAKTAVVLADHKRNIWLSLAASVLTACCAFYVGTFASRLAMLRAEVWRVAKAQLASEPGAEPPLLPASYSIVGNVAMFHADAGRGMRRVLLVRSDQGWHATDSQPVETAPRGNQIIQGSGKVTIR